MRPVVENVSISIQPSETMGLAGESGSGKTTVARMILGLVKPPGGRIVVDGINVGEASGEEMRRVRRQMRPVFQDPFAALNPRMKVADMRAVRRRMKPRPSGARTGHPGTPDLFLPGRSPVFEDPHG
jgi:peptide/nickel transport system ATP-binding protein